MNLTFFKSKVFKKGIRAVILLFLGFLFFGAKAQSQSEKINDLLLQIVNDKDLTPKDIEDWKVTSSHVSRLSNVEHIYFRQAYQGIEINSANASLHITSNGRVLASNNQFIRNLDSKIYGPKTPILSAIKAIEAVSQQLNYKIAEPISIISVKGSADQAMNSK